MQLLTDKTFKNEDVAKITELIIKWCSEYKKNKDFSFSELITYEEFKNGICNFLKSIMTLFLEDTDYKNDKNIVIIKPMPKKNRGSFLSIDDKNILMVNEQEIKDIYRGNFEKFIVLFHELNHFKIKYDIKLGFINEDIARIIKERLIRESSQDPFNEINSIKVGDNFINDDYYSDNYYTYSEEIYVQIQAINDYICFVASLAKSSKDKKELITILQNEYKNKLNELTKRYENHIRDFTASFYFNSKYLTFEEAFDLLIVDNKEWLEYPQIAIEYYMDENNVIRKRSIDQLMELLNKTDNSDEIAYINVLINKRNNQTNKKIKLN